MSESGCGEIIIKYGTQNLNICRRFLLSGADVVTTATYQASITGFISHLDMSPDSARELLMSGVELAKESVKRFVSDSDPTGTELLTDIFCAL